VTDYNCCLSKNVIQGGRHKFDRALNDIFGKIGVGSAIDESDTFFGGCILHICAVIPIVSSQFKCIGV